MTNVFEAHFQETVESFEFQRTDWIDRACITDWNVRTSNHWMHLGMNVLGYESKLSIWILVWIFICLKIICMNLHLKTICMNLLWKLHEYELHESGPISSFFIAFFRSAQRPPAVRALVRLLLQDWKMYKLVSEIQFVQQAAGLQTMEGEEGGKIKRTVFPIEPSANWWHSLN